MLFFRLIYICEYTQKVLVLFYFFSDFYGLCNLAQTALDKWPLRHVMFTFLFLNLRLALFQLEIILNRKNNYYFALQLVHFWKAETMTMIQQLFLPQRKKFYQAAQELRINA